MEFSKYGYVIIIGFLVWMLLAPRSSKPQYGEKFLAYMVTLLFCLIASSEIMMIKPTAFFFTIGGVMAFCYVVARSMLTIRIRRQ